MNSFSKRPFFFLFCATSVWLSGAWKSMIGPGAPKSLVEATFSGLLRSMLCRPVVALVVRDEGDARGLVVLERDREHVAAERVGVLLQLAALQVQRPDVVDVAVLRNFRLDRLSWVEGGGGEDDRVRVEEPGRRVVVGAEGQLRPLLRVEVEAEELLVSAHPRQVDDELPVGREGGRVVVERVVGDVGQLTRVQVEGPDVALGVLERGEHDQAAVRRDGGRLGFVDVQLDAVDDLLGDDVLDDDPLALSHADDVRDPVAARGPRQPGHRVPPRAGDGQVVELHVLVESGREVADDRAVLARHEDDVELAVLAVAGDDGEEVARGRRLGRDRGHEAGLFRARRQVAAVVGRALLVAERLEAVLQVLLERLVELLGAQLERLVVGAVAAADHRLPQREEELPDAFLAPARLHELEGRVAEVVDQPGVVEVAVTLEIAHLRHDVRHGGVADRGQVERRPVAGFEVRQPLVDPQRLLAADERLRDDVELEDVRQFVRDRAIEQVRGLVEGQQHAVARGLRERGHAFLRRAGNHVLLLEIDVRLEEHQRDLEGQVVLEIRAHLLVRAFRVTRHPFEMLLDFRVVVDDEVVRRVAVPLEVPVVDQVLAEVGHERGLRGHGQAACENAEDHGEGDDRRRGRAHGARAHMCHLSNLVAGMGAAHVTDLTVTGKSPATSRVRAGCHLSKSDTSRGAPFFERFPGPAPAYPSPRAPDRTRRTWSGPGPMEQSGRGE
jgi:hypothetical protein